MTPAFDSTRVSLWRLSPEEKSSPAPRTFLLVALPLIILLLRTPTYMRQVVDEDEAIYAVIANQILAGGVAYRDAAENKPPLTYYYYAAVFALFGKSHLLAVHILTALWVWATALVLAMIAAEAFDRRTGPMAASLYAVFTTTSYVKILAANSELLGTLPLACGMLCGVRALRGQRGHHFLAAGIFFGIAVLFKQQLAFGPLAIVLVVMLQRSRPAAERLRSLTVTAAGTLIPLGLTCAFFAAKGAFWDLAYWSVLRNFTYVSAGYLTVNFAQRFVIRTALFAGATAFCWLWAYRSRQPPAEGQQAPRQPLVLFWLWLAGAMLATMVGGRFYGHYYVMPVAPLSLLAAQPAVRTWDAAWRGSRQSALAIVLLVVLPAFGFLAASLNAPRVMRDFGESIPDYSSVAAFVAAQNPARAPIFVWGFAPTIYLLSGCMPATRFSTSDYLTGRITGSPASRDPDFDTRRWIVPGSWSMLMEDFARTPPFIIVDTAPPNLHDYGKYPISRYSELDRYVREHYTVAGIVEGVRVYRRVNQGR